jgi:hypothetical protein
MQEAGFNECSREQLAEDITLLSATKGTASARKVVYVCSPVLDHLQIPA